MNNRISEYYGRNKLYSNVRNTILFKGSSYIESHQTMKIANNKIAL